MSNYLGTNSVVVKRVDRIIEIKKFVTLISLSQLSELFYCVIEMSKFSCMNKFTCMQSQFEMLRWFIGLKS